MKLLVITVSFIVGLLAANFANACKNNGLFDSTTQTSRASNGGKHTIAKPQ